MKNTVAGQMTTLMGAGRISIFPVFLNKAFTPTEQLNEILQISLAFPLFRLAPTKANPAPNIAHIDASTRYHGRLLNDAFSSSCGISPDAPMNKHIFDLLCGMKTA